MNFQGELTGALIRVCISLVVSVSPYLTNPKTRGSHIVSGGQ